MTLRRKEDKKPNIYFLFLSSLSWKALHQLFFLALSLQYLCWQKSAWTCSVWVEGGHSSGSGAPRVTQMCVTHSRLHPCAPEPGSSTVLSQGISPSARVGLLGICAGHTGTGSFLWRAPQHSLCSPCRNIVSSVKLITKSQGENCWERMWCLFERRKKLRRVKVIVKKK